MKKVVIVILVVVSALIILFVAGSIFSHKNKTTNSENPSVTQASELKGVSLSPKSYQGSDFSNFFSVAAQAGKAISWGGDWHQLADSNSAPSTLAKLSGQYSFTPVIIVDFPNLSDENEFVATVSNFVKQNNIKYIGIGNEVNFDNNPVDFETGMAIFNKTYDAIKSSSPDTVVFTIFQYEKLNGLQGGLFGGTDNPSASQWNLLSQASKADAIGFTTYPGLVYNNPPDLPLDYYSRISQYTNKPIIFTEVGWFRDGSNLGSEWASSQSEQATFINDFFSQTSSLNSPLKIWAFLYDQQVQSPFNTMGLLESNQTDSPAFEAWKNN